MKKLLWILVGLVALVVVGGMLLPGSLHLERSVVIDAPPHTIFPLVNGYARFNEWSPWAKIDPTGTDYTFSGPGQGVGAAMSWTSDHNQVGSGSQKIVGSTPNSEVLTTLDFGDQGIADAFFRLSAEESGGTRVTWGFDSDLGANPIGRIFGNLFIERMLGPQYEEGLAGLKTLAESLPQDDWSDVSVELMEAEPVTMAYISGTSNPDPAEIGQAFAAAYSQVMTFVTAQGLEPSGQPLAVNKVWGKTYEFDAGIPVLAAPAEVPEDSEVLIGQTYGGPVVRAVHTGSYDRLDETYQKIEAYMTVHGLEAGGHPWDIWVSDPGSTPEDELITHVHYPIK